ncbi:MAG: OmpA family protein [Rhodobacteraceae bacterium]|nr:OmpA family protein [Paracoccaceae bacterium]
MTFAAGLALALALTPVGAQAISLTFPAPAVAAARHDEALGSYALPVGPWTDGHIPTLAVEGPLHRTAWRLGNGTLTTLQILAPLRDQLAADGFQMLFDCLADACGGFDFRYGTAVLPEPEMHVDLGDFRFLSARRAGQGGPEYVSLLVSRSSDAGFVQVTQVGGDPEEAAPPPPEPAPAAAAPPPAPTVPAGDLITQLTVGGSVALDDLQFDSGSADLAPGDYASLAALAAWLKADPSRSVALVGHTDFSGPLDTNIALSKKRAASVADRLVQSYGVKRTQLDPEGVGYLAPRATNLTDAGRTLNRRVEVMITSTQ